MYWRLVEYRRNAQILKSNSIIYLFAAHMNLDELFILKMESE